MEGFKINLTVHGKKVGFRKLSENVQDLHENEITAKIYVNA